MAVIMSVRTIVIVIGVIGVIGVVRVIVSVIVRFFSRYCGLILLDML